MKKNFNLSPVSVSLKHTVSKINCSKKFLFILAFLMMLQLTRQKVNAQFTVATATEYPTYIGTNHNKTGSYVYKDTQSPYDVYHVSVYDGTYPDNAGFSYHVNSGSITTIPITGFNCDFLNTDVCIVQDQTSPYSIHALIALNVVSAGTSGGILFVYDYEWDTFTSSFVYAAGGFGVNVNASPTDINIDGDGYGNFAVIYDDQGLLNFFTGNFSLGAINVNNGYYPYTSTSHLGEYPDISLSYDLNNSTPTIYFTFVDYLNPDVSIYSVPYSDIASASISPSYVQLDNLSPIYGTFGHPRIATPATHYNGQDEWQVVIDDIDIGGPYYSIQGFNSHLQGVGGYYPIEYNSSISPNLTGQPNWSPVVDYDVNNEVFVGWNFDNTRSGTIGPPPPVAVFPVVMDCDNYGIPQSGYMEVPTSLVTNTFFDKMTLASRYAPEIYLTYIDEGNDDLVVKEVGTGSTLSNLRSAMNNDINHALTDNIGTEKLTVMIYDINGRLIYKESDLSGDIAAHLQNELKTLPMAIYVLRAYSNDGRVSITEKLVLGE